MTPAQVENEIAELREKCEQLYVYSYNRFYFDDHVILNVTTHDGYLASVQFIRGEFVMRKSNKKDTR